MVVSGGLMEEQAEARLEMQQGGEEAQRRLSPTQGTATFAGLLRGSQIRQNLERAKCLRKVLKWKHLGAQRAAGPSSWTPPHAT